MTNCKKCGRELGCSECRAEFEGTSGFHAGVCILTAAVVLIFVWLIGAACHGGKVDFWHWEKIEQR